ncbi:MAG: hypothetical protein ACOX6T_08645 [Myxococcales bacterium]|jgi:hypothetical protein
MSLSKLASLLLIACLSFACNRAGPPSAEYAEAREKWSALVRDQLDEAALAPEADEVLALLGQVDPKSIDAPYASELRAEIEKARAEAKAQAEARAKALEAAEAALRPVVADTPDFEEPSSPEPADEPPAQAAAAPDAGQTDKGQPVEDMPASDFRTKFARCFEFKNDSLVNGLAGGQVWGLKDLSICRDLHPTFVSNSVLLYEDKVAAIRPNEELAPKKYVVMDGKLLPLEEAEKLKKEKEAAQAAQSAQAAPASP